MKGAWKELRIGSRSGHMRRERERIGSVSGGIDRT